MPPSLVIFDVNETLSDLSPLQERFAELGAPDGLADSWFASTLRDGFALAAAGGYAPFRDLAANILGDLAEPILESFLDLNVHPDVIEGMHRLADAGIRMVTLSNGAATVARRLLGCCGLEELVEATLSVDDVRRWKPAPEPYLYAAQTCGVAPADCMLVAVHPWDVDGARRAGLQGGWVNRDGREYPACFLPPDAQGETLDQLAERLVGSSQQV